MSGIWAVVPVKELEGAKQRLAGLLPPEQRHELARVMLDEVLAALAAVRGLAGLLLVTLDPWATALGKRLGARITTEGAREGHTGAVLAGRALLLREGRAGMLTLPGDIPAATSAEASRSPAAYLACAASRPRFSASARCRSSARRSCCKLAARSAAAAGSMLRAASRNRSARLLALTGSRGQSNSRSLYSLSNIFVCMGIPP